VSRIDRGATARSKVATNPTANESRGGVRTGAAIAIAVASAVATAAPSDPGAAHVDWARGLVIASAVGIADRHAPSPAVARGTARRGAEDAARRTIAAAINALPRASGGTVGEAATTPATKAALADAVAHAVTLAADPETDGAWQVTLAVPIEAVRLALGHARTLPDAGDHGPAVIVIDGERAPSALGWHVAVHGADAEVATLWVDAAPAWAKSAPHVQASVKPGGVLELASEIAGRAGTSELASALFVIVAPSR